jgi:hypothetical protein
VLPHSPNMTSEPLFTVADEAILWHFGRHLTDVEAAILLGAIADQTYEQIAESSGYSISYVKRDVGPKLWRFLSDALGEDISKTNFRAAMERYASKSVMDVAEDAIAASAASTAASTPTTPIDKGNTVKVVVFNSHTENLPQAANLNGRSDRYSDIYVERSPIESMCYEALLQPGSLVRIKAPSLMGKTSLINRVLSQVEQQGYQVVSLSFDLADQCVHFKDINKFMRWFCVVISRELGVANTVDDYWDEEQLGAKISCTAYFEEYLLPQINAPLVVSLDDVDLLFPFPDIYQDFFSLLRSWHEKAKSRPIWKQLRLLLAHTTDVYIRLDINQSPFNVGIPIELSEFTAEQVQHLAQQFGVESHLFAIAPLIQMVGGHPYLLEQAFTHLKIYPQSSLDQLLADAPTEVGIYRDHLRDHWLTLQQHPELMSAFKAIATSSTPVPIDPSTTYQLQRMGLVKFVGNQVMPRCKLYQQYFAERL